MLFDWDIMKDLFFEINHALSYSRFEMFDQCELKYDVINISKIHADSNKHDGAYAGQAEHKELELYCKGELSADAVTLIKDYLPFVDKIRSFPGDHSYEGSIAIAKDFQPISWFASKDVWFRVQRDVTIVNSGHALVLDWKTGKRRDELVFQMEMYAFSVFIEYPEVDEVTTMLYYLREPAERAVSLKKFHRDDFERIKQKMMDKTLKIYEAIDAASYAPKGSPLCNYCPNFDCNMGLKFRKDRNVVNRRISSSSIAPVNSGELRSK